MVTPWAIFTLPSSFAEKEAHLVRVLNGEACWETAKRMWATSTGAPEAKGLLVLGCAVATMRLTASVMLVMTL